MDKPRIALVCTSLNQLGGKNNHLKNIYHGLKDKFEVFIVLSSQVENELRDFMQSNGVEEKHLIFLDWRKKWLLWPFLQELSSIYKQYKFDIVHTFQMQSDVFGGLAARFADIKKVLSYYESRVITENDSLPKRILYRGVNKLIKDMFVSTVVVSNGLKKEVEEEGFRPAGKVEVIHLGIEVPPEYASRSYSFHNLYNGEPVIGTISRFSFEKALDRFVEAAPFILKKVPGARFLLVGKGPDEDKLRTRIKELGLENKFEFREWTKDPFKTLEEIDIFFMSSLREGCPTALLEAMALRRPVVASDIEGVCDIVENGVNGILVNTADASAFGDAIIRLCEDPAAAVLMGQKGFATIRSSFIMGAEMNKIKNLYFKVLFGK